MSVSLTNNANNGTNGAAVTYYNSGAQSGDAWDYIYLPGGNSSVVFSSTQARGALSYKWAVGATTAQGYTAWNNIPEATTLYARFYVYLPTLPPTSTRFCQITDGIVKCFSFGLTASGRMSFRDGVEGLMGQSTITLPVGRWLRIEGTCTSNATAGSAVVRIYTEADSPYPAEVVTLTGAFNTRPNGVGLQTIQFGLPGSAASNWSYYIDGMTVNNTGWAGPADPNSSAQLLKSNNAEMGTNGTGATMDNTGDAANTPFQYVKSSSTITFSNAQASHGSLSYLFSPTSGNDATLTWMGMAASSAASRVYVRFTAVPSSTTEFATLTTTSSEDFESLSRFGFTGSGKLSLLDNTGVALWTSAATLTLNTWYRFEMEAILGGTATTGTINAAYYLLDNTTAVESFSTNSATLGTVNFGWARFGKINQTIDTSPFYMDGMAVRQLGRGFIGPYTTPVAPTAYPGVIPHLGWGIAAQASKVDQIPIFSDSFSGSNGSSWDSTKWVSTINPTSGGGATIQSNTGRLQSGTTGGYSSDDRIMRRLNVGQLVDFDMTCTFSYDASEAYGSFIYHDDRPDLEVQNCYAFEFSRSGTLELMKYVSFTNTPIGSTSFAVSDNTSYKVRIRVVGSSHNIKLWAASANEPSTWNLTVTDGTLAVAGNLGFSCAGGGTAGVAGNFFIDDVSFVNP